MASKDSAKLPVDTLTEKQAKAEHARLAEEIHFVCPWHGYEYDLKTGECAADRNLKLRKFEVLKRWEDIYVVAS